METAVLSFSLRALCVLHGSNAFDFLFLISLWFVPSSTTRLPMETARIAQILDEMGTILEIQGENPFRCRAYHNAAQVLGNLPADLSDMIADGSLAEVPGIGETMLSKIVQLSTTGNLPAYEKLREADAAGDRRPPAGSRPRSQEDQGSLGDAEGPEPRRPPRGRRGGKIAKLKGFGAKTEANILEGIAFLEKTGGRILQIEALFLVAPIFEAVRQHPQVIRAEICGSLRRAPRRSATSTSSSAPRTPARSSNDFVGMPKVAKILAHGSTKASVLLPTFRSDQFVQCDLRGVEDVQFPFALHYFTGSKAHNIAMRKRALAHGYSLNEYALAGDKGEARCRNEADLFKALGLAEIPPELREDNGEIEAAEKGKLPNLVTLDDLTGTFHCHTSADDGGSDGHNTLEEMADAAPRPVSRTWGSPTTRGRNASRTAFPSSACTSSGRRSTN